VILILVLFYHGGNKNTKNKIAGIFVSMLLITTCVVPIMGEFISQSANITKDASYVPSNDAAFDQKISFLMRLAGFPSLSACIIKGDQIIWSKGYGYYDRSERKPATIDTNYVIASITKTIVGTALMQLYEKGLFGLDDDVNAFLPFELRNPNFPDDPITFRMLLSHTSSLNTNNQTQYYWMNFSGDPPFSFFPEPYLREFLLPGGRYYDPSVWSTKYRPGEYAMYTNVGFDIISYLVEIISGEPFLEYCNTHIFSPLDMKNTGFNFSHFDINQVAIPYQRYMGRYYTLNELYRNGSSPDKYWRMRFYPAGGLYTTVSDLSHFLIAHMNGGIYNGTRILKKETVELMHETQPGNQIGYGLAWMHESIGGLFVSGHAGDLPGADTWMLYNQTEDIGVIYLANGNPYYSALPFGGWFPVLWILDSLFTKEGTLRGEMQHELIVSSDPFFMTPLIVPRPMSYGYTYN
jgi:CubicO group peptidase (beta-lactamase class C family)